MNNILPLSYTKHLLEAPTPPEPGVKKFRIELIANTSDRACHWPGSNEDYFYENEYDEPEETPEYTGELDQSLSLKEINSIVKEEGLDESKVFFTASLTILLISLRDSD